MPRNLKESDLAEAPDNEVYAERPIQNYGLSLLQGMGFTKDKGIGKNQKNALNDVLVLKPRPKGQGLGAEQEKKEKKEEFTVGSNVLISHGEHKDLTGIVMEVKESTLLLELHKSHSQLTINKKQAKTLTEAQYLELKQKQQEGGQSHKKKRLKWIVPGIKVKITDKTSSLYLKKVVVTDLVSEREFQCLYEAEEGKKLVRDLREKDVQTVVPKPGGVVLILKGPHQGEKGRVYQRDKHKEKLIVQTTTELEMVTLTEDDVAEFVQL